MDPRPGHHAEGGDVGEAGQDLGHALPVHAEPLDRPVAGGDCILQPHGDHVLTDMLHDVKLRGFNLKIKNLVIFNFKNVVGKVNNMCKLLPPQRPCNS